jgi:hypothetical protein
MTEDALDGALQPFLTITIGDRTHLIPPEQIKAYSFLVAYSPRTFRVFCWSSSQQYRNDADEAYLNVTYHTHHMVQDPAVGVLGTLRHIQGVPKVNVDGHLIVEARLHTKDMMEETFDFPDDLCKALHRYPCKIEADCDAG